jgi:hypothetical protein
VQALERNNGRADNQRLRITAKHLDANKTFWLLAQLGDSSDWTVVTSFKSSARGRGRVTYLQTAAANSRRAFPDGIHAVTEARVLAIADETGYVILSVNLHAANTMRFELATVFENAGTDMLALGCLAVACENGGVQFRLLATAQSSQLTFCVNDAPVATYAPDATGLFRAGVLPFSAPSPLLFKKMTLRNASEQVVLQTDVR